MVAGEGRGMTAFGWRGPDAGVRWVGTLRLAGGRGGGGREEGLRCYERDCNFLQSEIELC